MQAIAPGSKAALQAGHSVGVVLAGPGVLMEGEEAGFLARDGEDGGLAGAGGRTGLDFGPAAAATATGAGATVNGLEHEGQRNCLPAESSGICIAWVQCGQRITSGM